MKTTIIFALMLSAAGGDKKWMDDTAQAGMAEVRLGQLALKNSQNEEVKKFAQMMVDDHSKANEEFKALATQKTTELPADVNADQKKTEEKLTKLMGEKFDHEFLKVMVSDHKKVVSHLEKGTKKLDDADVKAWAGKMVPAIKHHLEMAESTEKSVKNSKKSSI